MTYREMLKKEMDEVDGIGIIPLGFATFLKNYSAVIMNAAYELCQIHLPSTYIENENCSFEPKQEPLLEDILSVVRDDDFTRGIQLSLQNHHFLNWLLNQEITEEFLEQEHEEVWYGVNSITKKWNEFAEMHREEMMD